jgi:hypothetical protein
MFMTKRRSLAVVAAMMVLASGCSDEDGGAPASNDTVAETDTTAAGASPVDTAGETVPGSVEGTPVDAAAMLQIALDDLAGSDYHFVTVVTAGGSLALQAEGDHVGDGTRFVVMRDDVSVEYIVTADGAWAMPAGEEWNPTDAATATVDPVQALSAATAVTVEASDGTTTTLVATVPDTALGYDDDRSTEVTVTLVDGAISELRYETTVQGLAASVLTTLGPVSDDSAVVAPV